MLLRVNDTVVVLAACFRRRRIRRLAAIQRAVAEGAAAEDVELALSSSASAMVAVTLARGHSKLERVNEELDLPNITATGTGTRSEGSAAFGDMHCGTLGDLEVESESEGDGSGLGAAAAPAGRIHVSAANDGAGVAAEPQLQPAPSGDISSSSFVVGMV